MSNMALMSAVRMEGACAVPLTRPLWGGKVSRGVGWWSGRGKGEGGLRVVYQDVDGAEVGGEGGDEVLYFGEVADVEL